MKENQYSLVEILLIECLFFFAFFGVLKFFNLGGSPRFFILSAIVLLASYVFLGLARYIEMQKNEEADFGSPRQAQ